jgi:hypothetical protein
VSFSPTSDAAARAIIVLPSPSLSFGSAPCSTTLWRLGLQVLRRHSRNNVLVRISGSPT